MFIIGVVLAAIGGIIIIIYGIILLIKAFKESMLWGLGYLLVPFCNLVFIIMHWGKCKKPFLIFLLGALICAIGIGLLTPTFIEAAKQQGQEQQGRPTPRQ